MGFDHTTYILILIKTLRFDKATLKMLDYILCMYYAKKTFARRLDHSFFFKLLLICKKKTTALRLVNFFLVHTYKQFDVTKCQTFGNNFE